MRYILTFILTLCASFSAFCSDSLAVIYRIRLDQDIDKSSQRLVTLGLEKASEAYADYILLDLDTYGGAVDAADSIRSAILRYEKPVIAFINMQAASAGALMRMDTCKVSNLRVAAYYLKQSGFRLVAATEKTENLIYDVDMTGPVAIIMGSEGKGISQAMLELADARAAIPMSGEITSLNVSVASALIMYEAVRQRLKK